MQNTQFLIIDPQNSFMDREGATLGVPGAMSDSQRLAEVISKFERGIKNINVTLDTHQKLDVAHPMMWMDSKGRAPEPFTIITADDVQKGKWRAFNPMYQKRLESYVIALEKNGRYPLCIWPEHTLVGSWGHNVVESIYDALGGWEETRKSRVDFIVKGHNVWTEHYSAVAAEVVDPSDPTTQLNTGLIQALENSDVVFFSGQALSHCVANTIRDIANNWGDDSISKLVLIEDTSSPVPGFENLADDFLKEMKVRGMQTVKSNEIDI